MEHERRIFDKEVLERLVKIETERPIHERLAVIEYQQNRFISDIESEKATHIRTNTAITIRLDILDTRQDKTDRIIWICSGALGTLQLIIGTLIAFYIKSQ